MRSSLRVIGTCLVVACLVAPVQAQDARPNESTPTTLYFHIFDTFNRFVINTQPMDTAFFDVGGTNNPTLAEGPWTTVTNAAPVGLGPWDLNTIYGTSTAGPVEYDFIENGKPRFHPEGGIAATVDIDESVQPVMTLYLDLRDLIGTNGLPTFSPAFTVKATIQEGDDTSRDANLDAGKDIMVGTQKFHMVDTATHPGAAANAFIYWATYMTIGLATGGGTDPGLPEEGGDANTVFEGGQEMPDGSKVVGPDGDGIVALDIPLEFVGDAVIPKSEAFNIRLDWYQLEEAFGEDAFASGYMRLFSGQTSDGAILQHHLDMNIMNPVYVEFIHPQVAAGTLLIHAGVNSPWGTYDVDEDNIEITIDGPSEPKRIKKLVNTNKHVHGLHDEAAQVTYLWDFRGEDAKVGEYDIRIKVNNLGVPDEYGAIRPETVVTAADTAKFTIREKEAFGIDTQGNTVAPTFNEEEVDTPGVGVVPVLALLGAALVVLKRRGAA